MFKNRLEAGLLLADKLRKYVNKEDIVLAVPRGGVPVAYVVAKELGLPLSIVLAKKIGHPDDREYAIGAASLTDHFVKPDLEIPETYIQQELIAIRKKLKEMQQKFFGTTEPESIQGKTVIIIDDGIATGNTVLATIEVLRKGKPRKIIVAVPVTSQTAFRKLSDEVDVLVTVECPKVFLSVGSFYEDFTQVEDTDVLFYLKRLREFRKTNQAFGSSNL